MANVDNEEAERIGIWLKIIDRIKPEDYVPLTDWKQLADGAGVQHDSKTWAEQFFLPETSPYHVDKKTKRSYHAATDETFDTLRHEYMSGNQKIGIFETASFMLIHLSGDGTDVLKAPEEQRNALVNRLAATIFKMKGNFTDAHGEKREYNCVFQFPSPLREGTLFSTNAGQSIMFQSSWTQRLDGGIHLGSLFFLFYKTHISGDGKIIVLDNDNWFNGKCWEPYNRAFPR